MISVGRGEGMIRVLCMAVGCVFALAGCFDIEQRI
jgi:hypothetical protein